MKLGDLVAGRFAIESLAASGGMGRIFRALDRETGTPVAVKVLLPSGEQEIARFAREAEMLDTLRHPRVVRALAHGATESGEPYLVLEWLDGEDLGQRLARGPLGVGESVALATHVAEALAAAHAQGIIHRDIKPSNLFLVSGAIDRVKVLDFGVARLAARSTRLTRTGTVVGTIGYMAPEQARGGGHADARADVFALGAVLFECLTGAPPFEGDDLAPLLAKILFEEAPRASARRPEIPAALDALIAAMLAKDPAARPSDGAALLAAIASASAGIAWPGGSEAPRAAALTSLERRSLSLVLVDAPPLSAEAETVLLDQTDTDAEALRQAAAPFGARVEVLADGSVVATLTGAAIATDQAARAARLAIALRDAAPLHGRRAIAVVTGRGESTGRLRVGDAVDRAARMLADHRAAPADAAPILLDDVTANLLDARFDVREADQGLVLRGERAITEGARTLLGKATACVGRDRELGWLEDLFVECERERIAQAAVVTGPAGIGKSRVAQELVRRIRQRYPTLTVGIGRGDPLQSGSSFAPLVQALGSAIGLRGESADARRAKLAAAVRAVVSEADAGWVTEILGEILGARTPDDEASQLLRSCRQDARTMSEHLQRAWEELLGGACAAHPVLLVLEDLHWGDGATVRFVDGALARFHDRPFMVLALGRPEIDEVFPKLWQGRHTHRIRLRELGARASERLVRQVLGERAAEDAVARIVAQADGNAFYLEELIRATAERGGEELPETVVAMVEARLARLDGEARRLLRAGSVFGESFSTGGVVALTGADRAAAEAQLQTLAERELLARRTEARSPDEPEYAFRHALLRDGAYAMLTEEDRALGHRLAGAWLLAHGEEDPLVLARHFELGRERARAASFYLAAARRAIRGSDIDAAIAGAERGRACGGTAETEAGLLGVLCEAYAWQRAWDEGLPVAREVTRLAPPGSAPWLQGAFFRITAANFRGDLAEFEALYQAAHDLSPEPAESRLVLALLGYLSVQYDSVGLTDRVDVLMRNMRKIADRVEATEPSARAWLTALEGFRRARLFEDPWQGYSCSRSAFKAFLAVGYRNQAGVAQALVGMNLWFLGALDEAEAALRPVAIASAALGPTATVAPFSLAWTLADRGALDEAEAIAGDLAQRGAQRSLPFEEGRGRWALAEVLRRKGDLREAERQARRALELLSFRPTEQLEVRATLALALLAQGRAEEALAEADAGLSAYATAKACSYFRIGWLMLARAEAIHALGDTARARAAIEAAHARVLRIAETVDGEAYRRSFLDRVPENARTAELCRAWAKG
jgi:tetratricopeptide (TPR) repeat protein